MVILRNILSPLQQEFNHRCKGDERGAWFVYTLLAVITHFTLHAALTYCDACRHCSGCRLVSADLHLYGLIKVTLVTLWATLWSLIPSPATKDGCYWPG